LRSSNAKHKLGLSLTEDIQFFVCHFFARPGEKMTHKKDKYHAAAGKRHIETATA
jgi:hypothetical protein